MYIKNKCINVLIVKMINAFILSKYNLNIVKNIDITS